MLHTFYFSEVVFGGLLAYLLRGLLILLDALLLILVKNVITLYIRTSFELGYLIVVPFVKYLLLNVTVRCLQLSHRLILKLTE